MQDESSPRKRRSWFRRCVSFALVITAILIWMNLHHVRPWAYLPTIRDEPAVASKLDGRVDGRFQADSLLEFVRDIERRHGVEVEFQEAIEKELVGLPKTPIDLEASNVTIESLLTAAISTTAAYRVERRGDVLEVMHVYQVLSPTTRVHPVMGGLAAQLVRQQGSEIPSTVDLTLTSPRNVQAAWLMSTRSWRSWRTIAPDFSPGDYPFSPLAEATAHGGVSVFVEEDSRHEAFERLDSATAGALNSAPRIPETVGRSNVAGFRDALLEKIDVDVVAMGAPTVVRRILGDKVPYVLETPNGVAYQRPITLQVTGIARCDALRLALRQCGLVASVGPGVLLIDQHQRAMGKRDVERVDVGDLFEVGRSLPGATYRGLWTKRIGSQLLVAGEWDQLRQARALIQAGHDAKKLTRAGGLVFVGDESSRRIQQQLLAPAKSLGEPKTAGELAAALRREYGMNVVVLPAHEDKKLATTPKANGRPLFRVLRSVLPSGEAGRFSVEHGALIIEFGGNDNSQWPEYWIRTPSVYDPQFETALLSLIGQRPAVVSVGIGFLEWPESIDHNPLTGLTLVRSDWGNLVVIQRVIEAMEKPPGDKPLRMGSAAEAVLVQKYGLPATLARLQQITLRDLVPEEDPFSQDPIAYTPSQLFQLSDGVLATGSKEFHQAFAELIERWDEVDLSNPEESINSDDWVTRHKAALHMISSLRVDADPEKLGRYVAAMMTSENLPERYATQCIQVVADLGEYAPDLTEHFVEPFKRSDNAVFRQTVINLMFRAGVSAQGRLHELTADMSPDELSDIEGKLVDVDVLKQRDWLPLILRVYDLNPSSRDRLKTIMQNAWMNSDGLDGLNAIPLRTRGSFRIPQ